MPRPSRNIDKLLLKTGLEMLPETGISGLNIREVVQRAQVNLGMFHYHFKTKDVFVRIMLQEIYETMFARIVHVTDDKDSAVKNLERITCALGKFARDNHKMLLSIIMDLKANNPITLEFVMANFPRHLILIRQQIVRGQNEGTIAPLPVPLIMSFLASSIVGPLLLGGLILQLEIPAALLLHPMIQSDVLSDVAIEQRVRMALKGVSP